jgi:hypothetical protein
VENQPVPEYLLTFELEPDRDALIIHSDPDGLRVLARHLLRLADSGDLPAHEHLKTTEWGGAELGSESQGGTLLNHVKIICWQGTKAG